MQSLFRRRKQTPAEPATTAGSSAPHTKVFPAGIKLLYSSEHANVDIVFVHGLTGDREQTWTSPNATDPWPKTLLPNKLPTARVLTFGYDAYVADWRGVVSQSRVGNHAWNLLTSLARYREEDDTNDRPIIFVCHSLGGLVCEDALVKSKERREPHLQSIIQQTLGIAFLGTPHRGAGLARWAEMMSRTIGMMKQTNAEIVQILRRDSEVLARIQDSFHGMVMARNQYGLPPIEITCFYEELPMPVIGLVVPQDSAILPGYIPIGIRGNHSEMTKFADMDDAGFTAVCGELRRWVKATGAAQVQGGSARLPNEAGETRSDQEGQDLPSGGGASAFLVPYPSNPEFVGRSRVLEQLKEQLGPAEVMSRTAQARVSLYGLGGIGKTQIALEYAYWLHNSYPNMSVYWVHASNAERFRDSFAKIAKECQIPGFDDSTSDLLHLVKTWLEKKDHGEWTMVIDNADDLELFSSPGCAKSTIVSDGDIARYLPECSHGAMLITTRNKQVAVRLSTSQLPIQVCRMEEEESRRLLHSRLRDEHIDSANLSIISSRLEHLPLALIQAAAFIQENSISVSEYLLLLDGGDQSLVELLSNEFETVGRDSETPRAVAETWMLSFQQIQLQNPFASELLSLMSFWDRQAIPEEFLSNYGERNSRFKTRIEFIKAIGVLKAFSLVSGEKSGNLDIHRLVQLVTRKWLTKEDTASRYKREALLTVSEMYPFGRFETRAICSAYLPHGNAVLRLDVSASVKVEKAKATLLHCMAGYLDFEGRWSNAEDLRMQAGEIRKRVLGKEHPNTLSSMHNLALTYLNQGRWKEAEELGVQVIETSKRMLGKEHPNTLSGMHNLASTYGNQGRWKEAEELEVQVMETSKRVLGKEHPNMLSGMHNLASIYWNQGRWKEAEELGVQVMETSKRVLGKEHPNTLSGMHNLASTYWNQGRWKEAEELGVQVMETSKRVLGKEHPDTLSGMHNLASTYWNQGRWKEAEELGVQVMETSKRVLGKEHPNTLAGMRNLASIYLNQGRWKEAKELGVIETRKRVLGKEHPDTLTSMHNLASIYLNKGRWKEAEKLGVQVMETSKRVLGKEHPDTLSSMHNLACTWHASGRRDEAVVLLKDCIQKRQQIIGCNHPHTQSSISVLRFWQEDFGESASV
ncbi:hypothetical protein QBC33DRAFT_495970 [Phialemonium atrogriseum]|uniref:NB-ARC domain-containing protein n=1 Tax=Phialemonium atrogriseum TaxID=1093897 RepID=A0AAJ0BVH0_9PEZI|nr:uncharacterized protein QBC33DRAFT_495970 [Phialemonium atrogriseum]KAK1765234.1 hypothetical protein QBC33DRAFT_495970 [Phialemonium atrogriseum]